MVRLMNAVDERLSMPVNNKLIPLEYGCDTWRYQTEYESFYIAELIRWGEEDPVGKANSWWGGHEGVSQDALFYTRPLVSPGFNRFRRKDDTLFTHTVRFERRFRSDSGFFVAYQMVEAQHITRAALANRYLRVPSWWQAYEVLQGFWADVGPIYTYFGTRLADPNSGLWTVFMTK